MREPMSPIDTAAKPPPPPATEGLGRLDQDRALSLADEGGSSAASLESQESNDPWDSRKIFPAVVICALAAVAIWGVRRAFRS